MIKMDTYYCINKEVLLPRLYERKEIRFVEQITNEMQFTVVPAKVESNMFVIKPENSCDKLKEVFTFMNVELFRISHDEVIPAKKLKFFNEINKL